MLRFLLKMMFMAWFFAVLLLLFSFGVGKTAPEVSKIAFFSQDFDGTEYWRLDMFTGVNFYDKYSGRIFVPDNIDTPMEHFLSVSSDEFYNNVSEINLYDRAESYIMRYPSRSYELLLAGDYAITVDTASQWRRTHIPSGDVHYLGRFSRMSFPEVSPDGQWVAGRIYNDNWLFLNVEDGSSYEIGRHVYMNWSPDGQHYLVGDYWFISVLNVADGSFHPAFPRQIPARWASWSADGELLIMQNNQLSLISLSGERLDYPFSYAFYWLQCLSPNDEFILSYGSGRIHLLELASGASQWNMPSDSGDISCIWSDDSRYLFFHLQPTIQGRERFIMLDSFNHHAWDMYPSNLPIAPLYLHIPD